MGRVKKRASLAGEKSSWHMTVRRTSLFGAGKMAKTVTLADPDPPLSSTLIRPPNSLFAHQKACGQIIDHKVVGK